MSASNQHSRYRALAHWISTGLLVVTFVSAGGAKRSGLQVHKDRFAHWGYTPTFMYAVGMVEILGAIALLNRRLAGAASVLLGATMLGAVYTHARSGEAALIVAPLTIVAILSLLAWGRLADARRRSS